jgi:hypothetical protein
MLDHGLYMLQCSLFDVFYHRCFFEVVKRKLMTHTFFCHDYTEQNKQKTVTKDQRKIKHYLHWDKSQVRFWLGNKINNN